MRVRNKLVIALGLSILMISSASFIASSLISETKGKHDDEKAQAILDKLKDQNSRYMEIYISAIMPEVEKDKRNEIASLYKNSRDDLAKILELEQKVKDAQTKQKKLYQRLIQLKTVYMKLWIL